MEIVSPTQIFSALSIFTEIVASCSPASSSSGFFLGGVWGGGVGMGRGFKNPKIWREKGRWVFRSVIWFLGFKREHFGEVILNLSGTLIDSQQKNKFLSLGTVDIWGRILWFSGWRAVLCIAGCFRGSLASMHSMLVVSLPLPSCDNKKKMPSDIAQNLLIRGTVPGNAFQDSGRSFGEPPSFSLPWAVSPYPDINWFYSLKVNLPPMRPASLPRFCLYFLPSDPKRFIYWTLLPKPARDDKNILRASLLVGWNSWYFLKIPCSSLVLPYYLPYYSSLFPLSMKMDKMRTQLGSCRPHWLWVRQPSQFWAINCSTMLWNSWVR